jgi:ferric-dicitrate binding protein FerR (iron transport regulator)/outer membrane murein-binding lipoprotein Lpp
MNNRVRIGWLVLVTAITSGCVSTGLYNQTLDALKTARSELTQVRVQNDALSQQVAALKEEVAKQKAAMDKVAADIASLRAAVSQEGQAVEISLKDMARHFSELQAAKATVTQELAVQRQRYESILRMVQRQQRKAKPPDKSAQRPKPEATPPTTPPLAAVGKVIAASGNTSVNHGRSTKVEALAVNDDIYNQDMVLTGASSRLRIRFLDGTHVTLGDSSNLEISDFVLSSKPGARNAQLTFASGAFRAIVETGSKRDSFVVQTPTATATVRGTDWAGEVTPDSTGVLVLKGRIAVANQDPAIRGEVVLTEGKGTDVKADRPPAKPKKWPPARVNAVLKATDLQ